MTPDDNPTSSESARRLKAFRSPNHRQPLHPAEKRLLAILSVHLCFLPWAVGTMHAWSQAVSLLIAVMGFVTALWPRNYTREQADGGRPYGLTMWPRLARFPIFWIGLLLLAYVVLQAVNPSWHYVRSQTMWWLVRSRDIPWLPTSIDSPFDRFNAWRQVIIYAAAWLMVCSVWVGLTRRRSLRILLGVTAGNALALGGLLALEHLRGAGRLPESVAGWVPQYHIASFVYKNHAGAHLALAAFCMIALASWVFDHGRKSLEKSTPALMLALGALFLVGAVLFTFSRGAIFTLAVILAILCGWFFLRQRLQPEAPRVNIAIKTAIAAAFFVFALIIVRYVDFAAVYNGLDLIVTQRANEPSVHTRLLARAAAASMLKEHWLRGVGAGGFKYLFPEYVKHYPEIYDHGNLFWEHAHCDWLEIPIELGLFGDLLILAGAGWGIAWFARHRTLWNAMAVPLLLGCLQTLIHAGFDFPFQCPAILITWCVLIAVAGRWVELEAG